MLLVLIQNIALLVTLLVGIEVLTQKMIFRTIKYRITVGLLFGIVCLVGMKTPLEFLPGVIYDGRSIVLSLAGLFGGLIPAAIAASIAAAYRLHIGGAGAWVGVAVILEAAALGVGYRYLRRRSARWDGAIRLLLFGVLVHLAMLGTQLLLPNRIGWSVVREVGGIILIGYPLGFLLAAKLFLEAERQRGQARRLAESEERYRNMFENSHACMLIIDPETGAIVDANPAAEVFYGWSHTQLRQMNILEINTLPFSEIQAVMQAARDAKRQCFTFQHRTSNGSVRDVEVYSGPINLSGKALLYSIVHDITQRKQAEEALRATTYRLQAILDNSPLLISEFDLHGKYLIANHAICALFGLPVEAIVGKTFSDLLPEDMVRLFMARIEKVLTTQSPLTVEDRLTINNTDRYYISTIFPLFDQNGNIQSCGTIAHDITERKQTEDRLAHSHDLLRYIIEHTNSGIAIHDRDLRYIYVSQRYLKSYNIQDPDIIGKHHYEVFPDLPQKWREVHQKALAGEISQGDTDPFFRADGTLHWTRWECRPWHESDGSIGGIIIYTEVITDRVEAQEALRRSEALQTAIIACTPFALYSIDPEGNVLTWNKSAERILGWTAQEVIGKPLPIMPDHEREAFAATNRDVLQGQTISGQEVTCLRKDGTLFTGRLSTAPILSADEQVIGIMRSLEDITASKDLEDQLRQAQKMESVGRLAGGVAHDFNNMLSVILGHTELAMDELPDDSSLSEDLLEIKKAAQRSAELTRQLLAFARRQTIAPRVLDLNQTVESMLKMLRRLIGEDIDLLWKPARKIEPIRIDPAQVDQLLANLCVNSRDAIGQKPGKVTIETDTVTFDEEYCMTHAGFLPGRYVMLAVSDDGCGMDEKSKAHIFEPFFTTKDVGEGTGLGLATVYGIVSQNNGFINVYSELSLGTTFRIYLPEYESGEDIPGSGTGETTETPVARPGETILLVEDEKTLLAMTSKMLERLGYHVIAAQSPGDALQLANKHAGDIHLLVTDVVMPEMNGRDLSINLMNIYPDIGHLFMSGYTANVIAHQGVLDEGVNFIQKPFSMQALGVKVRSVLDGV